MKNIKFYEFNEHEYYALIGAENVEEAFEIYLNEVAGESLEEIKSEGYPTEINSYEAFIKFGDSMKNEGNFTLNEVLEAFKGEIKGSILVDGCLL